MGNVLLIEEACQCDVVMLSVPIRVYEEVIKKVASLVRPDQLC